MMMAVDIPPGWQILSLGDLFFFSNGVNSDKTVYGSGIPFANVLEVITHEALTDRLIPGRIKLSPTLIARYQVRHGDMLFNRTSETQEEVGLASVYVGNTATVFGGFVFRGRPKTNLLDTGYSKYALRAYSVRQQIVARGQGGIRANIGQRDLKTVRVVVPPLADQRQIAEVLTDIDHQILLLESVISKKQAIKQGLMQQLLTGKTRLPGFERPWQSVRWNDVTTIKSGNGAIKGRLARRRSLDDPYPGFTASGQDVWLPGFDHRGDAVVVSSVGSRCGRSFLATGQWSAIANTHIVFPIQDRALASFLLLFMDNEHFWIKGGSGQPFVNVRQSLERHAAMPDIAEQEVICSVIDGSQRELNALHGRLRKAKSIKQGMMQELLTGRTRLPAGNEATT